MANRGGNRPKQKGRPPGGLLFEQGEAQALSRISSPIGGAFSRST